MARYFLSNLETALRLNLFTHSKAAIQGIYHSLRIQVMGRMVQCHCFPSISPKNNGNRFYRLVAVILFVILFFALTCKHF